MKAPNQSWWRFLLDQFELRMAQAEFGNASHTATSTQNSKAGAHH